VGNYGVKQRVDNYIASKRVIYIRLSWWPITCEEAVEKTERCAYTGLRRSSSAASSAASRRAVQAIQKRGQTGEGDDEQN